MTTDSPQDKAAQAREGLVGSIAGKAKEVAGAVVGRDDLVEEGQLQQAEARKRKAALADQAVADAKLNEAAQEMQEASRDEAEQARAARARADEEQAAVERRRASEHAVAVQDAERQQSMGEEEARQQADELAEARLNEAEALESDAAAIERQAVADRLRLDREAAVADQKAAQLRAQTNN